MADHYQQVIGLSTVQALDIPAGAVLCLCKRRICTVGGITLAHDDHKDGPKVKVLSQKDIAEKVDGKQSKATTVEVTLEPGQASAPHRHPGPVFGYVIEGEYEWVNDDQPAKTLKVGD